MKSYTVLWDSKQWPIDAYHSQVLPQHIGSLGCCDYEVSLRSFSSSLKQLPSNILIEWLTTIFSSISMHQIHIQFMYW